jgi:hypothetical protein
VQPDVSVADMHRQPRDAEQWDGATSAKWLLIAQGAYYFATGVWPLISMNTFERVTGPKTDKWLVKTVGVLVSAIGGTLAFSATRRSVSPEARLLALASACGLTAIDVIYVSKRRIAPVYLLDAAAELALTAAWKLARGRKTKAETRAIT